MHLHKADCCIQADSTLIKHSSALSAKLSVLRCDVSQTKKSKPPNFWRLKFDGSLGNNDHSVGVVKGRHGQNRQLKKVEVAKKKL